MTISNYIDDDDDDDDKMPNFVKLDDNIHVLMLRNFNMHCVVHIIEVVDSCCHKAGTQVLQVPCSSL